MSSRPLVIYVKYDDPVIEVTLVEFLRNLGNTALPIRDDEDLREKLKTSSPKPDVLVTGLGRAVPDGLKLLQQTHQQYPRIAVFLITNGGRSPSASEAKSCGVTAFLREPIRLSELELYLTRI